MQSTAASPLLARLQGEDTSLHAAIEHAIRSDNLQIDDMLPARVISYDRVKNVANVQPLIYWVDTLNNSIQRPNVMSVPVLSLGGGGFHINFPLKKDDLGWIKSNDRDLSLFLASLTIQQPPTSRYHSFTDSMFIPDVYRKYTINEADAGSLVIQTTDAGTRIAIDPNGNINITAPTSVNCVTPMANFSKDVTIGGDLLVEGNSTTTKQQTANGGFTASGGTSCTLPANTTVGGTNVTTHGHISESPGTRTANGMIP